MRHFDQRSGHGVKPFFDIRDADWKESNIDYDIVAAVGLRLGDIGLPEKNAILPSRTCQYSRVCTM